MFSMIFFVFVALVVIFGFLAVTWRRNRIKKTTDESTLDRNESRPLRGTFNETPTNDVKGGVLPADNKLSQNDFNEDEETIK